MREQFLSLLFLFLLLSLSFNSANSIKRGNHLRRGSSLLVEDDSSFITSPDNSFTCGFYSVGTNAYWFAIWFTNSEERTIAWMANRDKPVNGRGSRVRLKRNGAMVLTDVDGSIVWETNTTMASVRRAELLDSGNLVLMDPNNKILWQSFDHPTDTLLPFQTLTKSKKIDLFTQKRERYQACIGLILILMYTKMEEPTITAQDSPF